MTAITIVGAGAFGSALAISLAASHDGVTLVSRSADQIAEMRTSRINPKLPGFRLPDTLGIASEMPEGKQIVLMCVPTQALPDAMKTVARRANGNALVACCKGIDLKTGQGPTATMEAFCPDSVTAIMSGPSFADDIAAGLPTALSLATATDEDGEALQQALTSNNLRMYRTTDVVGVELGGALKNVVAIAAGITMGAGLGESARAAIMTRGFAEMRRFALSRGAMPETLNGLSGFGDLVLTSTSTKSRNYSFGLAVGSGQAADTTKTVEGFSTAMAIASLARKNSVDMPVSTMIADLLAKKTTVSGAIDALLSRPLKKE